MVILPLYWYTCIYCQNIVQMYCTAKYQQIIALHWCSMENYEKEVKDNTMNHNSDYLNVHWQARECKLIIIWLKHIWGRYICSQQDYKAKHSNKIRFQSFRTGNKIIRAILEMLKSLNSTSLHIGMFLNISKNKSDQTGMSIQTLI